MNYAAILPEIILVVGAVLLMMAAAFMPRGRSGIISAAACAVLVGAGVALLGPAQNSGLVFGGLFAADGFAAFGKLFIYIAAIVAILAADKMFERDFEHAGEYPVLVLLATTGMSVMVSASDLITLYVGLELNSLAAYVLAAYRRTDDRSAEAGLKYFILGGLASGILLYGISLLYGFTGSTGYGDIAAALAAGEGMGLGLMFGFVFLLAGLAFKISAVPFHMWTPDVYEGAPTPVTTFFASAPKVAAMLMATRVCIEALGPSVEAWRQIMIFAALASIVLGAVAAWGQTNIKRLLAYSSINNVGFALIGLAAGTAMGVSSVLFYMAIYVVMTMGAFLCVMALEDKDGKPVEEISALSGLSQSRPLLALAIAIFMFSLAGIPPLFGFWPKLLVFTAAVDAGLVALAVAGILGTVVGAAYYLRIVKILYFDDPANVIADKGERDLTGALIALAAIIVSPLGYFLAGPLSQMAGNAASWLF